MGVALTIAGAGGGAPRPTRLWGQKVSTPQGRGRADKSAGGELPPVLYTFLLRHLYGISEAGWLCLLLRASLPIESFCLPPPLSFSSPLVLLSFLSPFLFFLPSLTFQYFLPSTPFSSFSVRISLPPSPVLQPHPNPRLSCAFPPSLSHPGTSSILKSQAEGGGAAAAGVGCAHLFNQAATPFY